MRINTNVSALTALEANKQTNQTLSNSLEKLSTGLRINKASDDASGLSIADKLRTQANGLNQAVANGNSAVTLTQIADKAMAEQSNILDVIKQKLIQAGTATTSAEGIEAISKDITKLMDQIDNISKQTTYNGTNLLQNDKTGLTSALKTAVTTAQSALDTGIAKMRTTDSVASAITQQAAVKTLALALATATKATLNSGASLTFQMGTLDTDVIKTQKGVLSNTTGLDGLSSAKIEIAQWTAAGSAGNMQSAARGLLDNIDNALSELNGWRADFGSTQNQLESSIRNLMTQVTNTKAAESVIRDVDYAAESANFNKQNIISQAGTYAISQANNVQQNVMRLLQ
ncbi:flagellin [Poseidonibacter sp.]|uniref:flagellin N-terminal helical domain-containing protein n=1 Tax=Poseidonibacter sp. TaxID=2321188 RepID=UPI003C744161